MSKNGRFAPYSMSEKQESTSDGECYKQNGVTHLVINNLTEKSPTH